MLLIAASVFAARKLAQYDEGTCSAKNATTAMRPIGTVGQAGKPVCREPIEAEWLSIVRDLLGSNLRHSRSAHTT